MLFDQNFNVLSFEEAKAQLEKEPFNGNPTEADVENALASYYAQGLKTQALTLGNHAAFAAMATDLAHPSFLPGIGKRLLELLRKFLCSILNGASTADQILQAVLDALAKILPGGIFVASLAKMIVKFLLDKGITAFCAVNVAR